MIMPQGLVLSFFAGGGGLGLGWGGLALALGLCYGARQVALFWLSDCDLALRSQRPPSPGSYGGKTVWVVGASQGIGAEVAGIYARLGADLILSSRGEAALREVAGRLRPASCRVLPLDVTDYSSHAKVAQQAGRVDVLVLAAGASQRAAIEDTDISVDEAMMSTSALGLFSVTKAALPSMMAGGGGGSVVVISSLAGRVPSPAQGSYAAAKFALMGFFSTLRAEVADRGVAVTIACPGPVHTGAPGQPRRLFGAKMSEGGHKPPAAGDVPREAPAEGRSRISRARCAELIVTAAHHRLSEVWIARQPLKALAYAAQYAPWLCEMVVARAGPGRLRAARTGGDTYSVSLLSGKQE